MLKSDRLVSGATAFGIAVLVGTMDAQVGRGTTEWLTAGADAQRTFWIRTDPKISVTSMSQPGFEQQWTAKLESATRGTNALQHGVSANGVTLFVPMSVVAGSSNNIYALDNDTGYVVWQRHFDAAVPAETPQCPGGMPAGATRIVPLVPPPITAAAAGFGGGRGATQSYRSVIGQPGEGAPVETRGGGAGRAGQPAAAPAGRGPGAPGAAPTPAPGTPAAPPAAPAPGGAPAPPAARGGGGFGPPAGAPIPGATTEQLGGGRGGLGRPSGVVYALSSDGVLHVLGLPSGKDIQRPAEFLPPNARWSDPIAVNTTLYATTTGNCGRAPNAVWAVDLETEGRPVVSWKTNGGPIVGRVAFATDGTLFAAIGAGATTGDGKSNAIVGLDAKTLQVKDWFTQPGAEFVTGPTVFKHNDREYVAAATKDGRVVLLDATALGGADHRTPRAAGPIGGAGASLAADALATWQETTIVPPRPPAAATAGAPPVGAPAATLTISYGTRWILAATTNGIAAAKLTDSGGTLTIERGWTAQNLAAPATPIVVNGVVFALATGRTPGSAGRGTPAVLRAYDGTSGKELWTSGKAMTTSAFPASFWSALSQVYVGTTDGTLHTFGFVDERR